MRTAASKARSPSAPAAAAARSAGTSPAAGNQARLRRLQVTAPAAGPSPPRLSRQTAAVLRRYPVPSSLKCGEVAGWMDANSPYAPEWAQTNCQYSFNGQLDVTPPRTAGGGVSLTAKGNPRLSVSVDCPTDLPQWAPSGREGRTRQQLAWINMIKVLDAHEGRHRAIGQTWKATLQQQFRATNVTVTGTDQDDARSKLSDKLADNQQKSQAAAQAAQSKIDPFRGAHLTCPADTGMEEIAPQPNNIGQGTGPAQPAKLDDGAPAKPKPLSPELQQLFP